MFFVVSYVILQSSKMIFAPFCEESCRMASNRCWGSMVFVCSIRASRTASLSMFCKRSFLYSCSFASSEDAGFLFTVCSILWRICPLCILWLLKSSCRIRLSSSTSAKRSSSGVMVSLSSRTASSSLFLMILVASGENGVIIILFPLFFYCSTALLQILCQTCNHVFELPGLLSSF